MHIKALQKAVEAAGGSLVNESSGRWTVYQCEAPVGKVWAANGCHCVKVEWLYICRTADRDDAIGDAMDQIGYGTADCEDAECDYCHPEACDA